jgi:MFS family permease
MAGTFGGVMNTSGALASIASPTITGFVAQYFGFQAALALGGVITFVGILFVVFLLTSLRPLELKTVGGAPATTVG